MSGIMLKELQKEVKTEMSYTNSIFPSGLKRGSESEVGPTVALDSKST